MRTKQPTLLEALEARVAQLEQRPQLPELLTVDEFAVLLKTTANAIRLRHARGQLPTPIDIGNKKLLWRISDVSQWLSSKE
jgi:predicted DNA-binding transcriptional regulator AlpA